EHEVDVLRVTFVTGRQRQAETHLRSGREPLGERERELGDAKRPLERPGHVGVRDPADLAALRVPEPYRIRRPAPHAGAPTARAGFAPAGLEPRNRTGTPDPSLRSWPVP